MVEATTAMLTGDGSARFWIVLLLPTMWCLLLLVCFVRNHPARGMIAGEMKKAFPILAVLTALLLGYGTYQALVVAPTEQTMGNVQRIFYYHVPSAWTGFCLFFINLIASIVYLISKNPKADALAVSSAEVGVVFCTIVLVTGPIWARPVWGIWWTWDVRLTQHPRTLADLCELSGPAPLFRQRANPSAGRRAGRSSARSMCRWFISRSGSSAPSIRNR